MPARLRLCLAALLLPSLAPAAMPPFACADYTSGKVCLVSAEGKVEWEYAARNCNDLWLLPNGNLLFNTGHGVREVTRDKQVVFDYTSKSEIYACQRLANGDTFIGECNSGRLLEVALDGSVRKEVRLLPEGHDGGHGFMRNARKLDNGHYLVTHYRDQVVREYDADGKLVFSLPAPGGPHSAIRLPNGHTLVACGDLKSERGPRVFEADPSGATVWELRDGDLPGIRFAFMSGLQRLPNGNTVISNWLGHGKFGTAPHLFEVTRDKQVVWRFADHTAFRTVSSVQVREATGAPLPAAPH
jgi:hypothetical protein